MAEEKRKISPEELKEILAEQKKWLESDKKEGKQADLSSADLSGAKLIGANLSRADLSRANLSEANLSGAILSGANLCYADLSHADLTRANLSNVRLGAANLSHADLSQADLTGANLSKTILVQSNFHDANLQNIDLSQTEISAKQLGATNLFRTTPPNNIPNFDYELKNVEEASKNARKLFVSMLLGCLYLWLTIGTTKDIDLLLDSSSSPLPVLGATISTTAFYLVAPLLLLGFYIYFHLYLQRLWENLSSLPAIFKDGKRLDEKAYPWLLNGFVFSHFEQLKPDRPRFSFLQTFFSVALAWVIVPVTIFGFWLRYLCRHYWFTYFHIAFLSLSIWSGIVFYQNAVATLKGKKKVSFSWKSYRRVSAHIIIIAIISSSFYFFSDKAMKAEFEPFFTMSIEEAKLKDKNLRKINLMGAYLIGADLSGAYLIGAYLSGATLYGANLREADLIGADLILADLIGADLREANLSKANLSGADLRKAKLEQATFKNTKTDLTVEELKKRGAIVIEEDKK